jgi:hypothetical protein
MTRKVAHYIRLAAAAPVRFLQWVYQRRAYEPESAWRRAVDGQAGTRSRIYQVGMQETYLSENKLRQAEEERAAATAPEAGSRERREE